MCKQTTRNDASPFPTAVNIIRTNATSIQSFFPGQTQETTPGEASPSPPQEAVEEIAQNRHKAVTKAVTWRREADAKKNRPRDIEQGEQCGWFFKCLKIRNFNFRHTSMDASSIQVKCLKRSPPLRMIKKPV